VTEGVCFPEAQMRQKNNFLLRYAVIIKYLNMDNNSHPTFANLWKNMLYRIPALDINQSSIFFFEKFVGWKNRGITPALFHLMTQ